MVTAYQGGQIDALVQFDVLSGAPLFTDPNFTVVDTPTTNHRQIWMHTRHGHVRRQAGPPGVRPVRSIDRRSSSSCSRARAISANDHVIWQFYPYFSDTVHAAGAGHRRRPSSSCPMPATPAVNATLQYGRLNEIPDLAVLVQSQAAAGRVSRSPRPARTTARSTTPSGATRPSRPTRPAAAMPSSASSTTATGRARTSSSTRPTRRTASGTRRTTRTRRSMRRSPSSSARSGSTPRRRPARRSSRSATTTRRSRSRTSTTTSPATRRSSPACTRARSVRCSSRPLRPPSHLARGRPVAGRSRSASYEPGR